MTVSLERIVRPALAASIHPNAVKQEKQEAAIDEAVLEFGGPGNSVFTINVASYVTLETITTHNEMQRTVDILRVFNPEDHEQYVDTESVKQIDLKDESGNRSRHVYAKQETGPHVERLEENRIRVNKSRTGAV